jgi:hypothetical protein
MSQRALRYGTVRSLGKAAHASSSIVSDVNPHP